MTDMTLRSRFLGYALPGTVMILFGVGWCWGHAAPRASAGHSKTSVRLRCWPRLLQRLPVQGVLKLIVALVGIVGSLFAVYADGSFVYTGDVPFATVYLFFAMSGVVDVLARLCPRAVGRGHACAALALAFFTEALLFHNAEAAKQERAGAALHALNLLVGVMVACGASTALCGVLPRAFIEAVDAVRCGAAVVHGSWLYHCGMLLHWPSSAAVAEDSSQSLGDVPSVSVTYYFAWHCAAAATLLIVFLVTRRSLCSAPRDRHHRERSPPPPPPFVHGPRGHAGHAFLSGRGAAAAAAAASSPHHPHSHHYHSCVLCSNTTDTGSVAASASGSYHRGGLLV